MKVFLSWSGNVSHRVAICMRDWLPSVIQNIEPYVSSEDIDKGARWSTDIAKELENSSFGILCVTKENISAPWLNFEAGALSKTMDKTFVTPFLFDIKRSEVNGPILQFQSTVFEKEDLHKMVKTINKALEAAKLSDERLDKAFEVWFPSLEESLKKIEQVAGHSQKKEEKVEPKNDLMEEVLELTRVNQKLLRSLEDKNDKAQERIITMSSELNSRIEAVRKNNHRRAKHFHPMAIEEIFFAAKQMPGVNPLKIIISLWKDDFPWLYDAGLSLIQIIESDVTREVKKQAAMSFERLVEFSLEHPMMREWIDPKAEHRMMHREFHHILMRFLSEKM